MKQIHLHAGKHKTGTTAFQAYLGRHADFLADRGLRVVSNPQWKDGSFVWTGRYNAHTFAHILLRPDFVTAMRQRRRPLPTGAREQADLARRANDLLHEIDADRLVLSAEAFSFLRTPEERERFEVMFDGFDVRTIVVFREPLRWLESWRRQVSGLEHPEGANSDGSIFELTETSWLVDDAAIRRFFSPGGTFLDYEALLAGHGNTIPGLLEVLGLDPAGCPAWPAPRRWRKSGHGPEGTQAADRP